METVPKSNRKIVEQGIIYTPNTQIHGPFLFLAWYMNFNNKKGGLNYLYGPVLITLFVLINGGYGNEHHKVGVCMSRLIFPKISEHGPFPKQEKGKMTFLNNTAVFS